MRKRNNKINIFLSDDENKILKINTKKLRLSQSEYIRNLIVKDEINYSKIKEENKSKADNYIIENIVKRLEENIDYLIKVKNRFHYLGYFNDEQVIGNKIEFLKSQNSMIKKYLSAIKNEKDNAN